jgi:hypothetical protein
MVELTRSCHRTHSVASSLRGWATLCAVNGRLCYASNRTANLCVDEHRSFYACAVSVSAKRSEAQHLIPLLNLRYWKRRYPFE